MEPEFLRSRLVNEDGSVSDTTSGLLQIMTTQGWHYVCEGETTVEATASVACREMGYAGGVPSRAEPPDAAMYLTNFGCVGLELSPNDCFFDIAEVCKTNIVYVHCYIYGNSFTLKSGMFLYTRKTS